ncbi:MAG: hypothetical protein HUJ13_11050 [Hydrogenovibrio crunogenus]|uniref:Uncharacterized protein n=1 Tax=Hydrogenovibrio crunogenus (strain DSM 25203 / XCL-2) TaxID=317025 RepID=Q31JB3_HYDCU|nr:hypothetical protein [Hydrogenovibrio crunogenus]
MHYQVTEQETHLAKNPHHIFNINIIITHLFMSMIILEIGNTVTLLAIPFLSSLVLAYIYFHGKKVQQKGSWFVSAHWALAWQRSKTLLISYVIASVMVLLYVLIDTLFPGGFSMNDFSAEGTQTNLGEIITIRFAALVIFLAVLITFLQTGISVYDAGKGIIDPKIEKLLSRNTDSNAELGEGDDEVHHKNHKQLNSKETDNTDA